MPFQSPVPADPRRCGAVGRCRPAQKGGAAGSASRQAGLVGLQRLAGNRAVVDLLSRAGPHALPVQRTLWIYDGGQQWHDTENEAATVSFRSEAMRNLKVPPGTGYDDTTEKFYKTDNVNVGTYGTVATSEAARRQQALREQIVVARQRLDRAISLTVGALQTITGVETWEKDTTVRPALSAAFPLTQTATAHEMRKSILPHILQVLMTVAEGLAKRGVEFKMIGESAKLPAGAKGFVQPGITRQVAELFAGHNKKDENPPPIKPIEGAAIHLSKREDRRQPGKEPQGGETPWFILHEASHRFAGTLDYQYSPRDKEIGKETGIEFIRDNVDPEKAETDMKAELKNRQARDPKLYNAAKAGNSEQSEWYAMGKRALMNADSYAQYVLTLTGYPVPRTEVRDAPHDLAPSETVEGV